MNSAFFRPFFTSMRMQILLSTIICVRYTFEEFSQQLTSQFHPAVCLCCHLVFDFETWVCAFSIQLHSIQLYRYSFHINNGHILTCIEAFKLYHHVQVRVTRDMIIVLLLTLKYNSRHSSYQSCMPFACDIYIKSSARGKIGL